MPSLQPMIEDRAMNEQDLAAHGSAERRALIDLEQHRGFVDRHIGTDDLQQAEMLRVLGYPTREALIDAVVPHAIRVGAPLALPPAKGEEEALSELREIAAKNRVFKSF